MYFGSVKFFKHLILTVVFGWIAIATGLAVFFGVRLALASKDTSSPAQTDLTAQTLNIPDGTTLEQVYLVLAAKGYSSEDIMRFLEENDGKAVKAYIDEYNGRNKDLPEHSDDNTNAEQTDTSLLYTKYYPELYVKAPDNFTCESKTVYLTFDDGPSQNTLDILKILDKHNIKATFFMCGSKTEEGKDIMKKVADAGHTIGVHSYLHDYNTIYNSVEDYLDDFNNTYKLIYDATGVKPTIFRFPGGSINSYNRLVYKQIIAEMTRRGFVYYDWNISGEDASPNATWKSIYNNIMNGIKSNPDGRAIILLHDSPGKDTTARTVEDIIIELEKQGYTFKPLDNTVKPVTFNYQQ